MGFVAPLLTENFRRSLVGHHPPYAESLCDVDVECVSVFFAKGLFQKSNPHAAGAFLQHPSTMGPYHLPKPSKDFGPARALRWVHRVGLIVGLDDLDTGGLGRFLEYVQDLASIDCL